jgi:hypothetical protein
MKTKKTKAAKKPTVKHPVPEWMADDIKTKAEKLDPGQRVAKAEELERIAAELREFAPPPVKIVGNSQGIPLRPNFKKAVILFAKRFGADDDDEDAMVRYGIRWALEAALPKLEELRKDAGRRIRYELAEGLQQSVYVEQLIGDAIEKWKAARAAEKEEDDGD